MSEQLGEYRRVAVFGGVYNNALALEALLADARARDVEAVFCLGDMGGFGPHPDRVFPLLREHGVQAIQGNYDESLASGRTDCGCGYTDPRDNHYAAISYHYTFERTSAENKTWLGALPRHRRLKLGPHRVLMCHGSPRVVNEFLWESATPNGLLRHLMDRAETDVMLCTHTGMKWHRALPDARHAVNVGVIGRPENDGRTNVWYTVLTAGAGSAGGVRPARLRPRDAGPRDGPGGPAARVRGDDPHRLVDHLPREPARPRARPGQVLSRRVLVITLLALAVAVVLVRVLGLTDLIRLENLTRLRDRIDALGPWAPLVFIVGYVLAVVAFVPALPLTILGGLVFGTAWGTVYVIVAATTGACLSFLIARYAARAAVARWMAGYPALERMDRAVARHGFRIVMITRLVPIFPFNLQNYAYGLTSIGFGAYAVTSFLCMLPGTLAFTAAAGAAAAGAWDARRMLLLLALAGVLLVALSLLPRLLRGRSAALDDLLRSG